jgi:hypothetical protein
MLQILPPTLKEVALCAVLTASDRSVICRGSFFTTFQASEKIGADSMEQVVMIERKSVDRRERRLGSFNLRNRYSTVECDDGARCG